MSSTVSVLPTVPATGPSFVTRDVNQDGIVDLVRPGATRGPDGWISVSQEEGLRQVLQASGLNVHADGEAAEKVFANIDEPTWAVFDQVVDEAGTVLTTRGAQKTNLSEKFADFVSRTRVTRAVDVNALILSVIRESYIQNTEDLRFYAQKVQLYNDLKKKIRERTTEMRKILAKQAGRDGKDPLVPENTEVERVVFDLTPVWDDELGKFVSAPPRVEVTESKLQNSEAQMLEEFKQKFGFHPDLSVTELRRNFELEGFVGNNAELVQFISEFEDIRKKIENAANSGSSAAHEPQLILRDYWSEPKQKVGKFGTWGYASSTIKVFKKKYGFDPRLNVHELKPIFGVWKKSLIAGAIKSFESRKLFILNASRRSSAPTRTASQHTDIQKNGDGTQLVNTTAQKVETKAELEAYIQNLEEQLNSVGDDAQLANVDLQNMLQKQQQTLQQMSNISKLLHDTAMSIIRKIGG